MLPSVTCDNCGMWSVPERSKEDTKILICPGCKKEVGRLK